MQLECNKCKYEMEKDEIPPRCPYCGEFGTVIGKRTAEEILDEVKTDAADEKAQK